mgnify:CR=1 FL=1
MPRSRTTRAHKACCARRNCAGLPANRMFAIGTPLADAQRELIVATLQHHGGNKRLTAAALGISVKSLYNRLKEYQVLTTSPPFG